MELSTKMPKSFFYGIIFTCAWIIFCESLQIMMRIANPNYYLLWIETLKKDMNFDLYVTIQLSYFFGKIIIPVFLGVYTYIAFIKVRVNKLFVGIWTLMLSSGLIRTIGEMDMQSVLYYCKIIGYLIGILIVMGLLKVIEESRFIKEG